METLIIVIAAATVAIPALTEVGSASQSWHLPVSKLMAAARYVVLIGFGGMIAALTVSIVAESANAAGYARRDRDADAPRSTIPRPTRIMDSVRAFACNPTT